MNYPTKILVIDDDQRLGRTIKNLLSTHGYEVCYANSGALGIQKAFESTPDLILCDIRMEHVDGYHVFKVLKDSALIDHVPFIFLTGSSELEDIRHGMDLGADDYFIKPFNNDDLIRSIENRLTKFKKLKEFGRRDFKALFKLAPNGIFIFDQSSIMDANPVFLKMMELDLDEILQLGMETIFEINALPGIKEKIQHCLDGTIEGFKERVTLISKSGQQIETCIFISVYDSLSEVPAMIGQVTLPGDHPRKLDQGHLGAEVLKILKGEHIQITQSLCDKLSGVFKVHNENTHAPNPNLFSKREIEVLCLSMQGLPMKMIADKLSISDRTVEKHREKLMDKTGTNNIVEVIVYALRNNLIEI